MGWVYAWKIYQFEDIDDDQLWYGHTGLVFGELCLLVKIEEPENTTADIQ